MQAWLRTNLPVNNSCSLALDETLRPAITRGILDFVGREKAFVMAAARGTPGPSQKITLKVMDREGRSLAYVKVAESEIACRALRREWRMLSHLAHRGACESIPRPLGIHEADGYLALAQSPGPAHPSELRLSPDHWQFLEGLIEKKTTNLRDYVAARDLHKRLQAAAPLFSVPQASTLQASLEKSVKQVGGTMCVCVVHGDFAPWNIRRFRQSDTHLFVHDWEQGSVSGLPLFDIFHFCMQVEILVKRSNISRVLSRIRAVAAEPACRRYMARADVSAGMIGGLLRLYLLERVLDEAEMGASSSRLQNVRLDMLQAIDGSGL
ncbi:MAG TPA: hypothetical protein VFH31_00385 [Pyrinomonadaceae bacterium]|nr:hypothetical protein [Pyrinomonadaceae bacterium]